MGYGEFGGNGSVAWKVDIDDVDVPGKKRSVAHGRDPKDAKIFTFALEYPTPADAQADLARLKAGAMKVQGSKIVFDINVEQQNEDQVRIEW